MTTTIYHHPTTKDDAGPDLRVEVTIGGRPDNATLTIFEGFGPLLHVWIDHLDVGQLDELEASLRKTADDIAHRKHEAELAERAEAEVQS